MPESQSWRIYKPQILEEARIINTNENVLCIVLIDVLKTVCVIVAALLLDRHNQQQLLLISICVMVVSLLSLDVALQRCFL